MATILDKEIAFVKLASNYLNYDSLTLMELVRGGAEISPHLWERIIEKISGIKFVDKNGYDFEDFTEAKTGSLTIRTRSDTGYVDRKGRITNTTGKIGHMRVAIWNGCTDCIDYFLIPPDHNCTSYSSTNNPQGAIQFSYSIRNDTYANNLEEYRVQTIEEVCKRVENEIAFSGS